MIKQDNIDPVELKELMSISLIDFKDYSTYYDYSDGQYYTTNSHYLNKLYKSLDLKNINFIKNLYELDKVYTINTINKRIGNLSYRIYSNNSKFYVLSKDSYDNYIKILNLIRSLNFESVYINADDSHEGDSYLLLDSSGLGFYLKLSLLNEDFTIYESEVLDSKLYLSYNMYGALSDKDSYDMVKRYVDNYSGIKASVFYSSLLDIKLTWSEVHDIFKKLKLKDLLSDEDNETLFNLSWIDRIHELSKYTVSDYLSILFNNLDRINLNNSLPYYDNILNENLNFFKLKDAC